MTKKLFKIEGVLSFLLVLTMLCALFSACTVRPAYEGAPADMRPINDGADGAILFVPTSWAVDSSAGIPMGYVSSEDRTMITLVYVSPEDVGENTVPQYWELYKEQFASAITEFEIVKENEEAKDYNTRIIAGKDAYEYEFKGKVTGLLYRFRQALLKNADGGLFIITYSAYEENYEKHLSVLTDQVYENFRFVGEGETIPVQDDNTVKPETDTTVQAPEGMKLVSTQVVDYLLFVPESWQVSVNTGFSAASSADGSGTVSVTGFSVKQTDTDAFWINYEGELKTTFGETALSYVNAEKYKADKLGGYDARTYEYILTRGGTGYRYAQTVLIRDGYIYLVTCCSVNAAFEANQEAYSSIVSAFLFK